MDITFLQYLILLLVALLFAKEPLYKWLGKKFGFNGDLSLSGKMDVLTDHYNHETTELLTNILSEVKGMRESQRSQNQKLNTVLQRLDEIMKYGVKTLK